jgi:hypothetical protein
MQKRTPKGKRREEREDLREVRISSHNDQLLRIHQHSNEKRQQPGKQEKNQNIMLLCY